MTRVNPGKKGVKICQKCGREHRGVIQKYKLLVCRHCFRELAPEMGYIRE
jgi:small subunit ribosomal protein S14